MKWIVFIYKVPSKPTKYRAYIWREIKKLGALYLQDGVCIAPDTDDVHLFIGSLAEKVRQFEGQEFTFLSSTFSEEKDNEMIQQFNDARNDEYRELIPWIQRMEEYFIEEEAWEFSSVHITKIREEFKKLLRQFQSIEARDYFESSLSSEIRLMIDRCRKRIVQRF